MLLRDKIYNVLKADILSYQLAPGSELREQILAKRFSVSKSPVREALMWLERENLVEVLSRQGYRVTPISIADARNMYIFRIVLESSCAIEAARHATNEQLKALDVFREVPKEVSREQFIKYNRVFHCALFEASGNTRMATVARELIEQMDRMMLNGVHSIPDYSISQFIIEHRQIIDALQARNGRQAAKLLRNHVAAAAKRALKMLNYVAIKT